MTQKDTMEALNARLREVLAIHFDSELGSPYWLERARTLGINPAQDIHTLDDLTRFGPMDESALANQPIEHFMPRELLARRGEWILAETGGTLGQPKFAVHLLDEFQKAFVTPFVAAAKAIGFPEKLNWLFIGPSGPHIISKAAAACARAMNSAEPFTVDFDPRWAKKLSDQSFARHRYLKHIEAQALNVLNTQKIGVLFGTPPLLAELAEDMPNEQRSRIEGIHFGGMPVDARLREKLRARFSKAVMLSGYGNTLFGVSPELAFNNVTGIDYFPHGTRLIYRIIPESSEPLVSRICQSVDYGVRGQVVVHRLDHAQLILNMVERDSAIRLAPPQGFDDGFVLDGLRDPRPIMDGPTKPALGLY